MTLLEMVVLQAGQKIKNFVKVFSLVEVYLEVVVHFLQLKLNIQNHRDHQRDDGTD